MKYTSEEIEAMHMAERARRPDQPVWVEIIKGTSMMDDILASLVEESKRPIWVMRNATYEDNPIGLTIAKEMGLYGPYCKVINQYQWNPFKEKYKLTEDVHIVTYDSDSYQKLWKKAQIELKTDYAIANLI
jgi:hypothetical protein